MASIQLQVRPAAATTTDTATIWKAAVGEYERITGVRIQAIEGASGIEGILSKIKKDEEKFRKHRHDGSKLDRFRTLVSQSLGPIDKLSGIITQATKAAFPPSEAVFAAVRYLISTANAVSADYDKISGFFEELQSYLHRLKVLEHQVPPIPELHIVITEVLTSVLVLCGICTKYIQTRRIVKAFRSLVSGEDAELKSAYDHFHKMVEREEGIVRNAVLVAALDLKSDAKEGLARMTQLQLDTNAIQADIRSGLNGVDDNLQAVLANTNSGLSVAEHMDTNLKAVLADTRQVGAHLRDRQASTETAQERNNILTWLSPLEFLNKQHATFEKRHKGTGQWLLSSDTFQRWLDDEKNSTLWCPGHAGAGKTVMVSTVVSYVDEHTERSQVAIGLFYCDYQNPQTRSEVGILSSLSRQIAEQCRPLPPEVKIFHDKYTGKMTRPAAEEYVGLIRVLARLFEKTYFFIDALDECPNDNRAKFLNLAKGLDSFVRFFITCRPVLDLQGKFANLSRIDIVAHGSDIEAYLKSVIDMDEGMQRYTAKDPNLKADIIQRLSAKADGMFLFAHLQILLLCDQPSLRNVRRALDELPTDLYALYEVAMARIAEQGRHSSLVVRAALSYIFCAKRPLGIDELLHAIGVEVGETELVENAIPHIHFLLGRSAGLIRADMESGSTSLVHHTLHEYLEKHREKLISQPETELARICLTYLTFDEFQSGPCGDDKSLERRLQKYCFLGYASRHWGAHFRPNQDDEEGTKLLERFLHDNRGRLSSSLQVLHMPPHTPSRPGHKRHECFPEQVTSLHIAAYWGLDKVMSTILREGTDPVDSENSDGATALLLAAANGHLSTVQLLLRQGAKVNVADQRGKSPVAWAARNGHGTVLELLLEHGATIVTRDDNGVFPMDWAFFHRDTQVFRVLLSHWANMGLEDFPLNEALEVAAAGGHSDMVQMLLEKGADVGWGGEECGPTPLILAVHGGHKAVVRTLLENGVDIEATGKNDARPLHWALGDASITRLLLEKGANVDATDCTGKTALFWAAVNGQTEAVATLVEFGCDVDASDEGGFTPLYGASLNGHEEIVRLLLENGADANAKDQDGWTALHAAAVKQHSSVVSLLQGKINNGHQAVEQMATLLKDDMMRSLLEDMAGPKSVARTNAPDLLIAVRAERLENVLALLEEGVEIDAEDSAAGWTALSMAAALGSRDIVQTLLEHGANIDKPGGLGCTPLHLVTLRGILAMVRLLVENGADLEARPRGSTALIFAANKGHSDVAGYLVQQGADVNADDYLGRRPLHWAARTGKNELMCILLDKGADINATDHWGRTALVWALEVEEFVAAELLLQRGADTTLPARDGTTALHVATFIGNSDLVRKLLIKGAECNARARGGLTALHIAVFTGHATVARLLLERGADSSGKYWPCFEEYANEGCDYDDPGFGLICEFRFELDFQLRGRLCEILPRRAAGENDLLLRAMTGIIMG